MTMPGAEGEGVVTLEDFKRFQSEADRKISELQRQRDEEAVINDDNGRTIAEMRAEMRALREQGYANDDPEMTALRKEKEAAEQAAKDAQRTLRQFGPLLKDTQASEAAWRLFPTDGAQREKAKAHLMKARTAAEMQQLAKGLGAILESPKPPPEGGRQGRADDEFDTGRSSGRGQSKITRAELAAHDGDLDWYRENKKAIDKWAADGAPE